MMKKLRAEKNYSARVSLLMNNRASKSPEINTLNAKIERKITLRKEKLEDFFFEKRIINSVEEALEIKVDELDIPLDLVKKFEKSYFDKVELIGKLLQDNDPNIVKFALRKLREWSTDPELDQDKNIVIESDLIEMVIFYLIESNDVKIKVK